MSNGELIKELFDSDDEITWCPGCGNFAILKAIKTALFELNKRPEEILMVSGIGQAAKLPHYLRSNVFNGLHGRALPPAAAAKIVNPELTVIVHSGDGDSYGEGGNHFIHNIRRNVDITHFVHDNQIYGLTKGQASPTTALGQVTGIQTKGNIDQPLNPLMLALAAGATFVGRGFSGHQEHLIKLMKEAIKHPGYALIDILQPCVSFNKVNTNRWYAERVYELTEEFDTGNLSKAMELAQEWGERIPIGIFYRVQKQTFQERLNWLSDRPPLVDRVWEPRDAERFMRELE
ncbi:2-oxoacid:acceptor oxidoreductase, beta subunit, pyruvate/2-ketoisovalerate family [Desulfosporosinus acidiphilus SJ4]|uniref:2-oxoacid:acceptor oxidoreductase, beta subunit, pyruvate/2-ketoisovalerate family n=1 Tax=Desulfosporosinus acidiphilus (strain DSM 22704 / JCM 16185 / SJ4) TaxID=646529 RepID=I4D1N3_DESAJ|nr:2-oxoacid:ferredoxin oxidoreductase subunit beta [Desulfosporosinus acidiphilus]AFM39707.1 2-oxoacid:acceptor oxidoreductase, beta subunit, pyruvate/2-ketoisovalerate family [Desulfosporosinus acidiphilus SJ4]